MRYLRLFESNNNSIKISVVSFPDGDVVACYPDGVLELYGDYYHDKINDKIKGFIEGLRYIKKSYIYNLNVEVEYLTCIDSNLNERISWFGDSPPKELNKITYKVNELLGIGDVFRGLRFEHEIDADEIEYLISKSKIFNLKYSERKDKEEFIKIFTFNIESNKNSNDSEVIRVEFSNWLHPIKTPGLTDYNIYYNDKILDVSKRKSKSIYRKLETIYKK